MAEQTPITLNHFALFSFTDAFWQLPGVERGQKLRAWLAELRGAAQQVDLLQVSPTEHGSDLLVWSAIEAAEPRATVDFFAAFTRALTSVRAYIRPSNILWGYTKPSQYTKVKSSQEIDAFAPARKQFLVIYPFVKTSEWYALSRDVRQGMMNGHIRVGKQYEEINQLLLYSFGVQDQEFVVVYEMDDLRRFSDLVYELRATEARPYTERDTPLHAAVYRPAEDTIALFE
jgi:chlorite dismutase